MKFNLQQILSPTQITMAENKLQRTNYGYIVYPGNNPTVIENALKKRNVWHSLTPEKQLLSACFIWKQLNLSSNIYGDFEDVLKCYPNRHILLNHFEYNHVITTKSGLIKTLKYYYSHELALSDRNPHVNEVVPTSYHIKAHKNDTEYKDFVEKFHQLQKKNFYKEKVPQKHCQKNIWFVKPESDNQGKGIILSNTFKQIENFIISKPVNSGWIIQKSIEKPMLYNGRKFDVRVWVLVTPQLEIYFYTIPYIRTSSSLYTTENLNSQVHLTNNTMQKHFGQYSKFEEGNTLPFRETMQQYLESKSLEQGRSEEIVNDTIGKIKELIIDTLLSARKYFGRSGKKKQFELFGYDFLLDQDYRVWLLEVNNNPYIGTPNAFIKDLMPKMIDEMMEIVLDPVFPPLNYTPVEEKKFELIHKEASLFRLQPIRMNSTSNETKYIPKRVTQMDRSVGRSQLYNVGKEEKSLKPVYSTPSETLKYLLDTYCFNDLDPFMVPVNLILSSSSLLQQQLLESTLKKFKLITQTRIARILLEPRIYDICSNILGQDRYSQKIKAALLLGFVNGLKTFKSRMFVIKNLLPLLSESIRSYGNQIQTVFLQGVMRLAIACGGFLDRSVFIPGESRQNEFVREMFIKSNALKLILYLKKKYPDILSLEVSNFTENLSEKDWQMFYEVSDNKKKRCYSPKVNTVPQDEDNLIMINASILGEQKPKVLSVRQNAQIKKFRMRRHSGISPKRE